MKARPRLIALCGLSSVALAVVLAGCGETTTTDQAATNTAGARQAQQDGAWPSSLTCPVQEKSFDMPITVRNLTGGRIATRSGDIDCYDWSGDRTPPSALNFNQIVAGDSRTGVLRARKNTDRNWRMRFYVGRRNGQVSDGRLIGEIRVQRPPDSRGSEDYLLLAPGQGGSLERCEEVVLGPAPDGATELTEQPRTRDGGLIFIYVRNSSFMASADYPCTNAPAA